MVRKIDECRGSRLVSNDLDAKRTASLLLVMIMGLAHLDTLEPNLVGDGTWARFVERSVDVILEERS